MRHDRRRNKAERTRAEMPGPPRSAGDGIAEATGLVRPSCAAPAEVIADEASMLMEQVVCRRNMLAACQRVVRNKGAAGVDGMAVDQLADFCKAHWEGIRDQLLGGTYRPQPVRQVEIPKPGGGVRTLGIPTVLDRMIQQALLQVLTAIFDPTFSQHSYGFRPGRSTHQAVKAARDQIAAGGRWVVDMDLAKFFDRVNHDVLMARVARRVKDRRVIVLIYRYLRSGMMAGGLVSPRSQGTPQGGPLSPLLSNILLDDLDKELERRGHRFVRYADDCNIYVQSRRAGERVLRRLERYLRDRLRLTVNRAKSAVDRPWKRKFLGYSVTWHRKPKLKVAAESVRRLKQKLRETFRRGRGRNIGRLIGDLTPPLRGWVAYYRLSEVKGVFEQLDQWVRRKLRRVLWKQWKRPRTRARELAKRGVDAELAYRTASSGYGHWRCAGFSALNRAIPTLELRQHGLVSLLDEHRRLVSTC
jgi:RNA-directed DNA polymerase